ncbi:uncharacterized protein LOC126176418 [Schistocerca cancellata]|uniref:uncharacterized protein LOC126176418 n=1 Tax=Schistocerca cancellata TaxID=274614 RepID=UPI002118A976|nr:uncharacterized protein LOC126176418 [Schistocerca cancellata]
MFPAARLPPSSGPVFWPAGSGAVGGVAAGARRCVGWGGEVPPRMRVVELLRAPVAERRLQSGVSRRRFRTYRTSGRLFPRRRRCVDLLVGTDPDNISWRATSSLTFSDSVGEVAVSPLAAGVEIAVACPVTLVARQKPTGEPTSPGVAKL